MFDRFLQSEAIPGPRPAGRKREKMPRIGEGDHQRHLRSRNPPIGPSPRIREQQLGSGFSNDDPVRESDTRKESVFQPAFVALDQVSKMEAASSQWLAEAREQLDECSVSAEEDGLPLPSEGALNTSWALLQEFSGHIASQPDIYPMDEAGIAIDFRTQDGRNGVLFVVDHDGSGAMFYCTAGLRGRLRIDDATRLPREGAVLMLRRVGIG